MKFQAQLSLVMSLFLKLRLHPTNGLTTILRLH